MVGRAARSGLRQPSRKTGPGWPMPDLNHAHDLSGADSRMSCWAWCRCGVRSCR